MLPGTRLLGGCAGWALLGLGCELGWLPLGLWALAGAALALLAILDAAELMLLPGIEVHRRLPAALAHGNPTDIQLRMRQDSRRARRVQVYDLHPGGWPAEGLPAEAILPPGREVRLSYRLRPLDRGTVSFERCGLRERSRFGLWLRRRVAGAVEKVRVYPNFAPLARFALISVERATRITGAHLQRRRGEGTEFHQLREFRIGDSLRQVDWKATARLRRPISREYQDERNQQLMLLLDTGRRMLALDEGVSHFDHALNATLVLGYLALQQGDSMGFMTTGEERRWLPPQRGAGAINVLLNALYDLEARPVATDLLTAATTLAARQHRRSLVMLVTNLRDDDMDEMLPAVRLLSRRHLVCITSLREQSIEDVMTRSPTGLEDALLAGGAAHYLAARREAHRQLQRSGVMLLDTTSARLPAALTEAYLSIKRSGRL
ncbi:MAG TPA: DUF58 domain-containing protein [Gammaproteobacteria bacterium]|jgi:uncharacterized protein (DUF58 family)